jgi:hypothetical protein
VAQRKKFLKNSDNQILEILSAAIPERLTFGPEGINRPDQATRIKGAIKDMQQLMVQYLACFLVQDLLIMQQKDF